MTRFTLLAATLLPALTLAQDSYRPNIADRSNEGELAKARFRIPAGMQVELAAAEPELANPVAFHIDRQGRVFVCETFRQQKGVEDNRYHMVWLHDDLAAQSVEDRVRMFRKHLSDQADEYTKEHDRIRLLEDPDGDGVFDRATVFADGFNDIADGTGAGVLHFGGHVYYTCIPGFYRLTDEDGDGESDKRELLSEGYGVRVAFRGHDSHGLTVGPDGRIYFSIGDRGYNITTREGVQLKRPDTGAVFRCEPDGSHLEVFAYGFRNPQELAFDDYGNLFTGDNNSDSGDLARWVYIVEGADIGWRMYFQYLEDRGPWNRERMWYPYRADETTTAVQPAYILPPITNIADGPSGLTYYPGTGLPDRYKGHFFLADFRGTAGNSGIRSFAVKPKGASFELTDSHEFIWSILATDVDFGYDGGLYVTDWVNGWDGEGKGRLYRFFDTEHRETASGIAELMRAGFDGRTPQELIDLLGHADRRVRQAAQFALAKKEHLAKLSELARGTSAQLPRIHAIWAIGQVGRREPLPGLSLLLPLLGDDDPEVRAQAARTISDVCGRSVPQPLAVPLRSGLTKLLTDESPRARSFAALALAKVATERDLPAIVQLLADNNDTDPVLRHTAVMALVAAGRSNPGAIAEATRSLSVPVRRAAVVALRRLRSPQLREFLKDADESVALEAARAIDDDEIDESQSDLAALIQDPGLSDALLRRVLNANFRIGRTGNAEHVAKVAANGQIEDVLRAEAMSMLIAWSEPPPLDRVNGRWRPLGKRDVGGVADVIRPRLAGILSGSSAELRDQAVKLAGTWGITEVSPLLHELLRENSAATDTRTSALRALDVLNDRKLSDALDWSLESPLPGLRSTAREIVMRRDPARGTRIMVSALDNGKPREQQVAINALAEVSSPIANTALLRHLDRLLSGTAAPETHLEILQAAAARDDDTFRSRLAEFESRRKKDDPLANYREALAGGDAQRGRAIFFGRSAASCRRCHKVGDDGGAVGPDLTHIAKDKTREYLLESLVLPNEKIAKGFETVVLVLDTGKTYTGIVKQQDEDTIRLMDANGATITINKDEIEDQAPGQSGMPADLVKQLSKSDLRDLVEYLAQQK